MACSPYEHICLAVYGIRLFLPTYIPPLTSADPHRFSAISNIRCLMVWLSCLEPDHQEGRTRSLSTGDEERIQIIKDAFTFHSPHKQLTRMAK